MRKVISQKTVPLCDHARALCAVASEPKGRHGGHRRESGTTFQFIRIPFLFSFFEAAFLST